jgi:phage shock protein A
VPGRASDLEEQTRSLERELAARRETFEAATTGYEEKARVAFKGGDLKGLSSLLSGVAGFDGRTRERGGSSLGRDPAGGQGEPGSLPGVRAHVAEHLAPDLPKKRDHEDALQEERAQTAELRRRQEDLQESIARISSQKAQTETRLRKLRAPERARILEQRQLPASR